LNQILNTLTPKTRWIILAATGGVIVFIAVWWFFLRAPDEQAVTYRPAAVKRGDIEQTIVSTGVVQPRNRLEIKPPIAGRIEVVLVREGDVVRKGQVIAWMSSLERAALLDAARAQGPEEAKRWEELYRPTPIVAPLNGRVIARNTEPGQTFTPTDAVFVLSDLLTIKAQVDETDIARIKLRQAARVTLDAYPDTTFNGQVIEIAFDAKTVNNVTTYTVDVLPQKPPAFLRSGMTANVHFLLASRQATLLVPATAVRVRDGASYVMVPGENKDPVERPVTTGISDGRQIEVLDGLQEGDPILVASLGLRKSRAGGSSPLNPFGGKKKQ